MKWYRVVLFTFLSSVIGANKISPEADHPNAEISGLSDIMSKNTSKTDLLEVQIAKEDLRWLISDLKSYVCKSSFNYGDFLFKKAGFWKRFFDIEFFVEKECSRRGKELNIQIRFARHMLNTMVYSAEKMQRYTAISVSGQSLIFKMLELNVRILALHSSDGTVDCWDKTVIEKCSSLERTWSVWREYMREKETVPPGMKKLFESQSAQAKKEFDQLKLQIGSCPIRPQA